MGREEEDDRRPPGTPRSDDLPFLAWLGALIGTAVVIEASWPDTVAQLFDGTSGTDRTQP